jgi:nitrite reductase/ring-hydroxylating ferredoxin subunit
MLHRLLPPGNRAPVRAIAGLDALDPLGHALGKAARTIFKPRRLKEALSGSWLGHPLHPVLTDLTIGTFASAVLLDWLGGRQSRPASQRLIGLGLLSAAPVVASGYSDWGDSELGSDAARRIGLVHAAGNATASTLFAASWLARRRGNDGRPLALAAAAALTAGGYLGGHLSFAEGIGVDRNVFEDAPEGWTDVLAEDEVGEGQMRCVEAAGTTVLVARWQGELHALSNSCSHRGAPLHEGEIQDGNVVCPWHASVFALRDGALIHGPAAYPQPAWDSRVRAGRIEVRRR